MEERTGLNEDEEHDRAQRAEGKEQQRRGGDAKGLRAGRGGGGKAELRTNGADLNKLGTSEKSAGKTKEEGD